MEVELQHGVKEFRKKEDGSGKLGAVVIEDLVSAVGEGAAAAIQIRGYLDRLDRRSMEG